MRTLNIIDLVICQPFRLKNPVAHSGPDTEAWSLSPAPSAGSQRQRGAPANSRLHP